MITLIIILATFGLTVIDLARQLARAYERIDALDDQNIELSIQAIGNAARVRDLLDHANELVMRDAALLEELKRRDTRINDLLDIVRMYDALYGAQVLRDAQRNQKRAAVRWVHLN